MWTFHHTRFQVIVFKTAWCSIVPKRPTFSPAGWLSVKDCKVYSSECTLILKSVSAISFSFFKLSHPFDDVLHQFHLDVADSWLLVKGFNTFFGSNRRSPYLVQGTPVLDFGYAWYSMDCNLPPSTGTI